MKIKTKQSETEFNESMLPHNRVEVFWDVLKLHWRAFLILSLVLILGFLPLLTCLFIRDNFALSLSLKVAEGSMSAEDRLIYLKYAHLICAGASWISLYFLAAAICVVTRFINRFIWYEPLFIKEDIALAFKNGYKSAFICATFAGIIIVINKAMLFVSDNIFIQMIPVMIFIPFIALPLLLTYVQSNIYIGKFSQLLRNSIAIYIKEAPKVLLFGLLLFAPLLFSILEQFLIVKYISSVAFLFLFENLLIMMFLLCSHHIFDKYINENQFPEIFKKGLYIEKNNQEIVGGHYEN